MIARSARLISIVISLILSFGSGGGDDSVRLQRLGWLIGGVVVLWILASSDALERWMRRVIERALNRWTNLDVRDYAELLKLAGEYAVREVSVESEDWLANKTLQDCRLQEEGVLTLGIYRTGGRYLGAPASSTKLYPGDTILLYGKDEALKNFDERRAGALGEAQHRQATSEHRQQEVEQKQEEQAYQRAKESKPKEAQQAGA